MSARELRIKADIDKIEKLYETTSGKVVLKSVTNDRLVIQLNYKTVADSSGNIKNSSTLEIQFGSRYPFTEPKLFFKTSLFNPHVYTSGQVCLGKKWTPTEFLDLLVQRVVQILVFEDAVFDLTDAANQQAAAWYRKHSKTNPSMFPTDNFSQSISTKRPSMSWKNTK